MLVRQKITIEVITETEVPAFQLSDISYIEMMLRHGLQNESDAYGIRRIVGFADVKVETI
jgi:hypothetical protein